MLEVVSNEVTVATGSAVPLEEVTFRKGCSAVISGTSSIGFNKAGVYNICVNATATSATATTGEVSLQIARNNSLVGISAEETVGDTTSTHNLSLSSLVYVPENSTCCNCYTPVVCKIMNTGNAAVINMNVVVTKVS